MTRYPANGPVTLKANICAYPPTAALLAGNVCSDLVHLEFAGLKQAHAGFKGMLRQSRYDASEMAVATYLQAAQFGKPFSLLPLPVLGRFHHDSIGYNAVKNPGMGPSDLAGKTVVARSYTQTTALWVRGVLQNDHGVNPGAVRWVVFDAPHLEEYADPASVSMAAEGRTPAGMLVSGEADAGILGRNLPDDPAVKPLIANPEAAAVDWYARHGFVPPNHFVILPDALCDERPDVVREFWRVLVESRRQVVEARVPDPWPVGIEGNRMALDCAIGFALQQGMLEQAPTVDELFHPLVREIAP